MITSPTTTSAAAAPTSTSAATSQSADAAGALSSDFETFLSLLTAQIRNQDPLKPADSTEFVAQLATFSNVEQAVRGNELLETIVARMDGQDIAAAGTWIGLEVRHQGPVSADDATVLHAEIPAVADAAQLVARDAQGNEVLRQAIDPDATTLDWPRGRSLPAGHYALHVEASAGDQPLTPIPVSHYTTVREVALGTDGTDLILANGTRLPTSALESVRRPEG
jgi:flagellar basal-body rod modification protein FlgD